MVSTTVALGVDIDHTGMWVRARTRSVVTWLREVAGVVGFSLVAPVSRRLGHLLSTAKLDPRSTLQTRFWFLTHGHFALPTYSDLRLRSSVCGRSRISVPRLVAEGEIILNIGVQSGPRR